MLDTLMAAVGLIGSALVIAGYLANVRGWLSPADWRYAAINLAGALLILASLAVAWNLPSAVIEGFWALISIDGLWRAAWRRRIP